MEENYISPLHEVYAHIIADLEEAECDLKTYEEDKALYAFNQGRKFAHNYDLLQLNKLFEIKEEV